MDKFRKLIKMEHHTWRYSQIGDSLWRYGSDYNKGSIDATEFAIVFANGS